jgi:hypothetical protein
MPEDTPRPAQAAIRTDLGAIFVSMELSRRAWLIHERVRRLGGRMPDAADALRYLVEGRPCGRVVLTI